MNQDAASLAQLVYFAIDRDGSTSLRPRRTTTLL